MQDTSTRSPTLDAAHSVADRSDRADCLVTEDPSVGHRGHVALEDVQVGTADRGRVDADDRVGAVDDHRCRRPPPMPSSGAVVHERFHGWCPPSAGTGRRSHGAPDGRGRPGPFDPANHFNARSTARSSVHPGVECRLTTRPGVHYRCSARRRVLVVDDEPSIVDAVATALRYEGFDVARSAHRPRRPRRCADGQCRT